MTEEPLSPAACVAIDLGASSWRVFLAWQEERDLRLEEIHRAENSPVECGGGLFWDIDKIFRGIKQVLKQLAERRIPLASIGIDSWSVDYGLLDAAGTLLEAPRCYRDPRNQGMLEKLAAHIELDGLFGRTAVMAEDITTLCQLLAAKEKTPAILARAATLLFIPDLLRYWLCGQCATDFTLATTSQLYHLKRRSWDVELLAGLGLPPAILPPVLGAGAILGTLSKEIRMETGLGLIPVITGASHDTAAAFEAAFAPADCAILSSGTWSILGVNLRQPLPAAHIDPRRFGYEGNPDGSVRLIHNVPGMWLLERCRTEWQRQGFDCAHSTLMDEAARCTDYAARIDPAWPGFRFPENMLDSIRAFMRETGQPEPRQPGEFTRAILLGLADSYAQALDELRALTNQQLARLVVVGGGAQNVLLNALTAKRARVSVSCGAVEAAILGNAQNQLLALRRRRAA